MPNCAGPRRLRRQAGGRPSRAALYGSEEIHWAKACPEHVTVNPGQSALSLQRAPVRSGTAVGVRQIGVSASGE